jgi:hypothetical protein
MSETPSNGAAGATRAADFAVPPQAPHLPLTDVPPWGTARRDRNARA